MTSQLKISRQRLWWGVMWRSVAWGLGLGSGLGAGYALLLSLPFIVSEASIGSVFLTTGAIVGAIGGVASGLVDGIGISLLTVLKPLPSTDVSRYLRTVRRTACYCMLLTCFAFWVFLFPLTLSAGRIIWLWTRPQSRPALHITPHPVSWSGTPARTRAERTDRERAVRLQAR